MQQNALSEEQIRIIFGLKLRQLRTNSELSLFGLAKLTGLSKSYLNEIEKGKKYPKTDKVLILAEALNSTYEHLVSMKVTGPITPLCDLIKSGVIKELPLNLFGIEESGLIDIVANAPDKVTSFIGTLFEIARTHDLTKERFYLAALNSYQQLHQNYFPDLEKEALAFSKRYQLDLTQKLDSNELAEILQEEFDYTINYEVLNETDFPEAIRSVFIPKEKKILIARSVSETQRVFILAKELGYAHLQIAKRPLTFSWIKFDDFDEVLNNFKASYFAGALIIPEKSLKKDLTRFFSNKKWDPKNLHQLMFTYTDSAETFFQRVTNILPSQMGIEGIFFLRLSQVEGNYRVDMTKELQINREHQTYSIFKPEHFCRRWVSVKILLDPEQYYEKSGVRVGVQISDNQSANTEYLILAASNIDPFQQNKTRSVCVGFDIKTKKKSKVAFANDLSLETKKIGVTCERCSILDCQERAAKPEIYLEEQLNAKIAKRIDSLINGIA